MIKDSSSIRKTDVINRRMFIIGAAKLIVLSGIVARLFSLQINDNKKYLKFLYHLTVKDFLILLINN